ncbi:MAG: ectonucleotide pyrophosphatase/phosphodiesterase [Salinibacter sp.]
MPLRRLVLLALLLVLGAGCASPDSPDASEPDPDAPLLLISIDGMRWDYLDVHDAPTLSRLATEGTHIDRLVPVFPSKTFPNHYSIVTGLYPSNHGIIANNMYDPAMDASFSLDDRDAVESPDWWGGEPIWVTAEEQGLTAATYFWPGSEAPIQGVRPSDWFRYDGSVPGTTRVDQALEWLDRPSDTRPDFMTLYFSRVDTKGHYHGPTSDSVAVALQEVDGFLQRLVDGLEARGIEDEVNLIVTSDHGMTPTSSDRTIVLDEYIDLDDVRLIDMNPVAMMEPKDGASAEALVETLDDVPHLSAYQKGTLPDTHDEVMRMFARRAARSVGDADIRRVQRHKVRYGLEQFLPGALHLRRKELEAHTDVVIFKDITNRHTVSYLLISRIPTRPWPHPCPSCSFITTSRKA